MLDQKFRNMKIILIHVFHRQMERMKKQIVLRIIYYQRKTVKIGPKGSYRARFEKIDWTQASKSHTPNIHALNSDTHTMFFSIDFSAGDSKSGKKFCEIGKPTFAEKS